MSDNNIQELPIPKAVANEERSIELVRVWAAGGKQHISVATSLWEDPATWGIMLVDLAKLIANAYQETAGMDRSAALASIKKGFDIEWGSPTDEPTGGIE